VGGKGSGSKRGRRPKSAGEPVRVVTTKMKAVIDVWVDEDLTRAEAAKHGGLTESALRKAMQHRPAQQYYQQRVKQLADGSRHKAVHTLLRVMEGKNEAAKVSASKVLLETEDHPRLERQVPGAPGLVVIIGSPGSERPPVNPPREPVTISSPRAITAPAPEREPVSSDDRGDWWRQ
jgi:hypothetical protein